MTCARDPAHKERYQVCSPMPVVHNCRQLGLVQLGSVHVDLSSPWSSPNDGLCWREQRPLVSQTSLKPPSVLQHMRNSSPPKLVGQAW